MGGEWCSGLCERRGGLEAAEGEHPARTGFGDIVSSVLSFFSHWAKEHNPNTLSPVDHAPFGSTTNSGVYAIRRGMTVKAGMTSGTLSIPFNASTKS